MLNPLILNALESTNVEKNALGRWLHIFLHIWFDEVSNPAYFIRIQVSKTRGNSKLKNAKCIPFRLVDTLYVLIPYSGYILAHSVIEPDYQNGIRNPYKIWNWIYRGIFTAHLMRLSSKICNLTAVSSVAEVKYSSRFLNFSKNTRTSHRFAWRHRNLIICSLRSFVDRCKKMLPIAQLRIETTKHR